MRKKQLPWNLHYSGHSPTPTILQSPYFFTQTVSPCVKLSSHPILEHYPSTIPSTPFRLPSSFNGSVVTVLPFQVTVSPTKQPKKPPPLPQTQFFLFLYLVLFKSLTRRFVTLHQHTDGLLLYTNIEGFLETQNRSTTEKMASSLLVYDPAITFLSSNTSTNLILHKIPPVRRTRSPSLAVRMSRFDNHNTTSVWVPSRVLRVACHSTWGCSGIRKEDPDQP